MKFAKRGVEAMKELLYERIPKNDLLEILGTNEVLEKIIRYSGGYPRDLLKLIQSSIISKDYPLRQEGINSNISRVRI